ncbi:extracellular solute-binding protein [Paenibacillus cymbidii]|uniref:extracellular solute-binding protein n=1 Tax=Paenibacillus cymbidii TaxID=1639034 RepID=UPI001436BCF8|nr:extracellular solute-binding protein [Paenibacillus cymbidii]
MRKGALLVAALSVTWLAACSSDGKSAAPSAQGSASAAPAGKFNPPLEVTTVTTIKPAVKFPSGDDYDNNVWTRAYLDNYGIKLKNLWVVEAGQKDQKTNLMITSGDLPDYLEVNGVQFKQLIDAGLIQDLSDAYKGASDSVKKILTEGGPKPLQAATVNGKLMGIPFTRNTKEAAQILWVRTDWLQKLNLPEPKTMDDVVKIAEAFATKDPDGNGKQDTYGLLLDNTLVSAKGFMNGYHAYLDIWTKDAAGKLAFSSTLPEMKTALQKLQDMYKAGWIDPEFAVKDFSKASESMAAGKIGMFFGDSSGSSGGISIQTVRDNDPKANFKGYPLLSVDSKPAQPQIESGVLSYWVVNKKFKQPQAVFQLLDFWVKTFYENKSDDIEDKFISSKDGNQPWYLNEIAAYRALRNVDIYVHVNEVFDGKKKPEDLTPAERGALDKIKQFTEKGENKFFSMNAAFGKEGGRGIVNNYNTKNLFMENEFYTTATPTMADKWSTLLKMENEAMIKIISGKSPIDEFDKFVASWKQTGGDAVTKEVNDWHASVK